MWCRGWGSYLHGKTQGVDPNSAKAYPVPTGNWPSWDLYSCDMLRCDDRCDPPRMTISKKIIAPFSSELQFNQFKGVVHIKSYKIISDVSAGTPSVYARGEKSEPSRAHCARCGTFNWLV